MKLKYILIIAGLLFLSQLSFGQGADCASAEPACAGGGFTFANTSDGSSAENGPDYGCLGSQPNPAWYFMQIDQGGNLDFEIIQNTQADFNGTGLDVDFICYGPFSDTDDYCNGMLTAANTVACSFSASFTENFSIPNAQAGEIYVLLITNYNGSAGFISLEQTNDGGVGAGTTNCGIVTNQDNYCMGQTDTLTAENENLTNYVWQYSTDGGTTFNPIAAANGSTTFNIPYDSTGDGNPDVFTAVYQLTYGNTSGSESYTNIFNVNYFDVPTATQPAPSEVRMCDTNNDGQETFDLTTLFTNAVLNGQDPAIFDVNYYTLEQDAIDNNNPIANPVAYISNNPQQQIWIRIHNNGYNSCFATTNVTLFVDPMPTATQPTDAFIRLCDVGADGTENFDLTQHFAEIFGGQDPAIMNLTYHTSQADADNDANPIADPTAHPSNVPQATVYIRVDNINNETCYATTSFELFVDTIPTTVQPTDLILCDTFNDGEEVFDLTQHETTLLNGQSLTDVSLTYHTNEQDAINDQNAIADPANYLSNVPQQTIWAHIHNNNNTSCYINTSFNVIVDASTTATQPADPIIRMCDNNADGQENFDISGTFQTEVLNGQDLTNVTVTYHTVEQDAIDDINPIADPANYISSVPQATIWIRVDNNNNNDCYAITSIELYVDTVPVAQTPLATDPLLHACDEDNDVTHVFDLTTIDATILGGLDPALYTLTYHPSQADADANTNALPDNFQVNAFTTDVFVRLENNANTSCYTTTTFQLFIHSIYSSALTTPEDLNLVACDDPTNNGLEVFDLQQHANNILGGLVNLNPVPATLTFHLAEQDAIDDVNPITGDLANYNSPTQSVWVRIENNDWPSCYTITQFEIIVNPDPTPLTLTHTYSICENYLTNGVADFYLSNQDATFANNPNYAISYHPTLADAQNDTNAISDPHVVNNNDTVFIRIEDTTTGCVNTQATMDLEVLPAIVPTTPTEPLTMCDPDNDGISTEFDLTLMNTIIAGNLPPAEIYYFATLGQAELGPVNAADAILQSPYTNVVPYNQTIYAYVVLAGQDTC
ncbi:hypothetical protein, partial [Pseudofulvibacter geojedonensis]